MIWSQSAINTWTGKYALLKFICSTGCVSCGFHGHSEDRFKCRLHSVSSILNFIFQRPERKIWVLIQGVPAQLQSVARTLKTETHSLHSAIRPLAVKPIVYVCARVCPRLLFVVHRRSVFQFLLFRATRGSAAPEAYWCRSRRLYVNSRRMLAETQKRVVVQHFLLFVSHSPLRWSSFGTIEVHHFPINRFNDFWMAPRLMLHDHICTNLLRPCFKNGRFWPCLIRNIVLI